MWLWFCYVLNMNVKNQKFSVSVLKRLISSELKLNDYMFITFAIYLTCDLLDGLKYCFA